MLEESFLRAIVTRTCESGQPNEQRNLVQWVLGGLWREVEVEFHLAAKCGRLMGELQQLASEGSYGCLCSDRHFGRGSELVSNSRGEYERNEVNG